MELCDVVRIGPDRSLQINRIMRDCLGFQEGATTYYYLIESTYYSESSEKHVEYRLIVSCIQPQIWARLYDLEFLLGDEPGAFTALLRILARLGITIQLGEARTRLWCVRSAVTLTAWFKRYEGTVTDLDHEIRKQIRDQPGLRKHIKPVQEEGDTEIWVRGKPSALQEITFEREFAPGTAGKSGRDAPIFLPPAESFSEVRKDKLYLPPFLIERLDAMFNLGGANDRSMAGGGYAIINVDLDSKLVSMSFPDPDIHVVKFDIHTEDDIGVLAGLSEALSTTNINLLETKLVTLEFSRHSLLRVIADVSRSPFANVTMLDMERDLGALLKRRGVRLHGDRPAVVQDIVGGPHTVPEHVEAFRLLYTLEQELRSTIISELSHLEPSNWWLDRIPRDVRENAETRAGEKLELEPSKHAEEDLLEYVDFASYVKILLRKNNWNQAFESLFPSREWLKSRLEELEPIRNDIAHGRELNVRSLERLRMFASDLLDALRHEPSKTELAQAGSE